MISDCQRITEEEEIESLRASDLDSFGSSEVSDDKEEDTRSNLSRNRATNPPKLRMDRKLSRSFKGKLPGQKLNK